MKIKVSVFFLLIFASGCVTTAEPGSKDVSIIWEGTPLAVNCDKKATIIGSQGNWYDFWFISNRDLTQGALNQLRNQAVEHKANTILLYTPTSFSTSVTFMANAYDCEG
jgi:hypothetical protein